MKRWLAIVVFGLLGVTLIGVVLLMPSYFRALDARVVSAAGKGTPTLAEAGLNFVAAGMIGPARILLQAGTNFQHAAGNRLALSLERVNDPSLRAWGSPAPELDQLFANDPRQGQRQAEPILRWLLPVEARATALAYLEASQRFGVREILRTRTLTNYVHFPPLMTATGQPLDMATLLAGLLLQGNHLSLPLKDTLEIAALAALRRGDVAPLESCYLDLLTLAGHLNWGQLTELLQHTSSLQMLRRSANVLRYDPGRFPIVYAAIVTLASPEEVTTYVEHFGPEGVDDLHYGLGRGEGAATLVARSERRVHHATWRNSLLLLPPLNAFLSRMVDLTSRSPGWMLALKYVLVLIAGYALALAAAWALPSSRRISPPWLGAHQIVVIGSLLILIVVVAEPSLIQTPQEWSDPGGISSRSSDVFTLPALLIFLVLQGTLYGLALARLGEIRRQQLSSQLKLKLLANEENLFDAGLYAGLAGAAAFLILFLLGFHQPSLTAAFASLGLGIIFGVVLKIGHLGPYRRSLLVNSEAVA